MSALRGEPPVTSEEHRRWVPLLTAAAEGDQDRLWQCAWCIWTAWTKEREATAYVRSLEEQDEPASYRYWRLAACQQAILDALHAWSTLLVELLARHPQPDGPTYDLATYQAACRAEIRRCRQWAARVQEAFLAQLRGKRVLFRFADPSSFEEEEAWDH